jgi:hypothetical protein
VELVGPSALGEVVEGREVQEQGAGQDRRREGLVEVVEADPSL